MNDARRVRLLRRTLVELVERVGADDAPQWAYQAFSGFRSADGDHLRALIQEWEAAPTGPVGLAHDVLMFWPSIRKAKGLPAGAAGMVQPMATFGVAPGDDGAARFKLRVFMTWEETDAHGEREVKGLGMRFEPPEDSDVELATHRFAHAQLVAGVRPSKRDEVMIAVPESQPSFPLDATDDLETLVAALLTIYGSVPALLEHVSREVAAELRACLTPRAEGQWKCWRAPTPAATT